ncbi:nodal homolog [Saccoglossus kowalevskii]|uniref:Nodal homolog n=2 Tax=Saccoglossus kowalevskii TaxID=10224 RepID=A0ABM0MR60_SACKO|nr:PREDICTED: nodal homolog [Saccoglossus kowalevskii]
MLAVIVLCVIVVPVTHALIAASADAIVPFYFGNIEDILIYSDDDTSVNSKQKGTAQMKDFAGSIDTLTVEFNQTLPRQHVASASYMLELYNALQDHNGRNLKYGKRAIRKSDTIRSFSAKLDGVTRHKPTSEVRHRYVFDISVLNRADKLRLAEMRFPFPGQIKKKRVHVTLYQLFETRCQENTNNTCFRGEAVSTQRVKPGDLNGDDNMVVFQVTSNVKRWLKSRNGAHIMEISVSYDDIVVEEVVDDVALLVTFTYTNLNKKQKKMTTERKKENSLDEKKKRKKYIDFGENVKAQENVRNDNANSDTTRNRRAAGDARRRKKKDRKKGTRGSKTNEATDVYQHPCERVELIVDFDKIGWGSWIIFPKKFDAYQCVGSCPGPVDGEHNPNNHAIIQNMVHTSNPDRVPLPCCVPTKLSSLSMLYYERGNIVVKEHEGMVIQECGCR